MHLGPFYVTTPILAPPWRTGEVSEPAGTTGTRLESGALRRSPEIPRTVAPLTPTAMILIGAAIVAALYLGRDVLIPLALAILLSFALGPLVTWLYRRGLPRVPAVLTVMLLVTVLIVAFAAMVASKLTQLARQLPNYEYNLRLKARELTAAAPGGGMIDRAADFLRGFSREIDRITARPAAEPEATKHQPRHRPSRRARSRWRSTSLRHRRCRPSQLRRPDAAADRHRRYRAGLHRLRALAARGSA